MGIVILVVLLAGLAAIAIAVAQQARWIYYPRPYPPGTLAALPAGCEALPFRTGAGAQVAFWARPASGGEPRRIWLLCGGQGNLALEWLPLLGEAGDPDAGFLLLDYPGFGLCEGSSTPARILAASDAAVDALAARLGWERARVDGMLGACGYSLGTGVAAQYAAARPVRRLVLAAPYTSLADMADLMFFPPCGAVLWHRFDTRARLAEIAARAPRPPILLLHGADDATIPAAMSRRMAAELPGAVAARILPGLDHDTIVVEAMRALRE